VRLLLRFVRVCGAVWVIASCSNPNDGHPISAEDAKQGATLFADSLAEHDLDSFRQIAQPELGGTLDESFIVEATCLDWATATVTEVEQDFGPTSAVATFQDASEHQIKRAVGSDGDTVFVTSYVSSCEGADPLTGPGQPDPIGP
jgi:hypothetical protein